MSETLLPLLASLARWKHRVALRQRAEFRTLSWTYDDLALNMRRYAGWLARAGIHSGDRLVLWAPNSPDWVAFFLAALASGIVVVPLDLHSAPDFVERVVAATQPRLLLHGAGLPPGLPWREPRVEAREMRLAGWEARQGAAEVGFATVNPDDLAEIVYTSGTTSEPRGVMLTQRNLATNLTAVGPIVPPEPDYRFVSVLPLSHVFEQMIGLLLPLSRGGQVTYLESLRPTTLADALTAERPNAMVLVPRLLQLLRDRVERNLPPLAIQTIHRLIPVLLRLPRFWRQLAFAAVQRSLGGRLTYLVVGGAPLDRDLEMFWNALGYLVLQGYGLTEAGPLVSANTPAHHRIGSVGRPVRATDVRIGHDGEILVRGSGVTPGYYHAPELTTAAFVGGYLRTGDLGAFDNDGYLYVLGRKKDLIVTTAGLKVYPEDVEAALAEQPGVRDSVVLEWGGQVTAVLLLDPLLAPSPEEIVDDANRRLNPVQRVTRWFVWPGADFPRTPTLKVQKYRVREALATLGTPALPHPPAASPVARIVQDLAPTRPVSPRARLGLDLGLSSIDRLEVITELEAECGIDLAESEITDETTVADLERLVHHGAPVRRRALRRWPLQPLARAIRQAGQARLIVPWLRRLTSLSVHGLDNLRGTEGPVIFAGNHRSNVDGPLVLAALPPEWRKRTAVAALAEFYYPPATDPLVRAAHLALFDLASLLFNVFPVPRDRGFRESLRYAGFLVDHGQNVLIFPEGTRSRTDRVKPFREGIGVLAVELQVPVVPFYLTGTAEVLPVGRWLVSPHPVTIRFGPPLRFPPRTYWEVTRQIERAVVALAPAAVAGDIARST
jgi:long-chain acyl-CoA synthetase